MAVKKAVKKKTVKKKTAVAAAAKSVAKPDAELVLDAYGEAVKKQVDTYFSNCINGTANAENLFLTGLRVLRTARDQAVALVNS